MRKLSHWLETLTPAESVDFYRDFAISHAMEGGQQGQKVIDLIKAGDLKALCEFEVDYCEQGLTAHAVKHLRQALAFFQKIEDLEIGYDKSERAFTKFLEAEELCRTSNNILKMHRLGEFSFLPRVSGVFHAASRKIGRILGDVPSFGELDLHFGPGATRATRRQAASIRRKLAERLQCSEGLARYVPYVLEELPHIVDIHSVQDRTDEDGQDWGRVPVEITPAKLSFVPKNAKTYRSIATEPGLNTFVQLGIGTHMARRLAAFGIDIRDQTVNQDRARVGSLTGELATLDLSSASDTISREIVYELLPVDWAHLLDKMRSEHIILPDGRVMRQEKFSSMGNGFTFPLETLIFWGLAAACCRTDSEATVYGDDIIVPTYAYELLTEVLVAAGFEVNLAKSYASGPFRESCGKDWYSGTAVRPYYPKGWVSGQSLFVLHNFYVRDGDTVRAERVESYIHPALRIYGPDGYGDGHLLGDHPRRKPLKYLSRGYSGYFFDTFVTRQMKDKIPLRTSEYIVPLYTIYRRSDGEDFIPLSVECTNKSVGRVSASCACTANAALLKWRLKYCGRSHGPVGPAPLPLPEGEGDVKAISLPGVAGYKKISVYTLGN